MARWFGHGTTRTAARDLREQLQKLGSPGANQVTATTLHSFCFAALLIDAVFQATNRRPRPLLSFEIDQLAHDLKKQFGGKRKVDRLTEAYEAAWARLQHEVAGAPRDPIDVAFEAALLDWLGYHRAMLIGELVPLTLRFIQANPDVNVLPPFQVVLVDEFQDLNKADQALVDALSRTANLTVIGDDNQSIYRFRHANPEGIRVFAATHPGTISHAIEECWRCPPNIVSMSNSLIAHDPSARQAALQAQGQRPPATVYVVQHRSLEDEADALAAFIDRYLTENPDLPPGQVLVLSTRRIFGNAIRDQLIRRHRNAMSFFWEDALKSDAAAEGFCLLTLLVDLNDRAAYRAWLGLSVDDGNRAGYARVRAHAMEHDLEPLAVCERLSDAQLEIPYTTKVIERHRNELVSVITQPELPDSSGDVIRVMSLHKSKGLTADLVVVAGCVSGALPTVDKGLPEAEQDAFMKEQRRLFYVAITRAKTTMVLSSVTRLPLGVALRSNIPPAGIFARNGERYARLVASPFIDELGPAAPPTIDGGEWRARLNI